MRKLSIHFLLIFVFMVFDSAYAMKDRNLKPVPMTAPVLEFTYGAEDGSWTVPCVHEVSNDTGTDWDVTCTNGKRTWKFGVHLVARMYVATNFDYGAYEILYTVADRNGAVKNIFRGNTVYLTFRGKSDLESLLLSQTIEQGVTALDARISR